MVNRKAIRELLKQPGSIFINIGGNSGVYNLLKLMLTELDELYQMVNKPVQKETTREDNGAEVASNSST